MRPLLLPLHGAFLVIFFAVLAVKVFTLIDSLTHPEASYVSAGKQTKPFWMVVLVAAVLTTFLGFLSVIGLVAALVYIVDVRPALRDIPRGQPKQHMGPYGPW